MFTILLVALVAAALIYLLALVSSGFAYELSRGVEAAFDFAEYRLALRSARRRQRLEARPGSAALRPRRQVAYKVSRSHAG